MTDCARGRRTRKGKMPTEKRRRRTYDRRQKTKTGAEKKPEEPTPKLGVRPRGIQEGENSATSQEGRGLTRLLNFYRLA
ncbi:hypothetical protein NDU88_000658 [Pleurodeles waltl]|uniref:Uncharacterized protein n=1 Tax=Pleurodeles waltl TaxID=8319 RepID=A0AAV7L993_PLEWA|nr:hypothetical protein NDU88_000658 [Pleurodeles waltl]